MSVQRSREHKRGKDLSSDVTLMPPFPVLFHTCPLPTCLRLSVFSLPLDMFYRSTTHAECLCLTVRATNTSPEGNLKSHTCQWLSVLSFPFTSSTDLLLTLSASV
jgi:hypothetical protein